MNYIFYDFETTGRNSDWDQILQLGAILTDEQFQEIDRFEAKCYLKPGHIPSPKALLVNQTTVENLKKTNLSHYSLINQIENKFRSWSPAIFIGYNSISFDEEFLRKALFKCLYNPYITINNGNKRADLLGLARATQIYNPEIIEVPLSKNGNATFKLDKLAPLNKIENFQAHDALGDSMATLKLAELIYKRDTDLWDSSLLTASKDEANQIVEQEKIFCITESFFGKIKPYVVTFVCYHPIYNWAQCFDLKNDPLKYTNLSFELLEDSMSASPKIIRSVRNNKHPIIMKKKYLSYIKEYAHLNLPELVKRSDIINNNEEFKQKIRSILDKQASYKKETISQLDVNFEETIYHHFASNTEKEIMLNFHTTDWKDKIKIASKFKDERHYYFAERLIYEESPQSLPKELYTKIHRQIAKQILSPNNENWNTIPKAYKEIDDLRDQYEQEGNEDFIKRLNDLNIFIEDIEKKYQDA